VVGWQHEFDRLMSAIRKGANPSIELIHVRRAWCTLARECTVLENGRLFFEGIEIVPTVDGQHCGPRGIKNRERRKKADRI
jgi:hypothetical protein